MLLGEDIHITDCKSDSIVTSKNHKTTGSIVFHNLHTTAKFWLNRLQAAICEEQINTISHRKVADKVIHLTLSLFYNNCPTRLYYEENLYVPLILLSSVLATEKVLMKRSIRDFVRDVKLLHEMCILWKSCFFLDDFTPQSQSNSFSRHTLM